MSVPVCKGCGLYRGCGWKDTKGRWIRGDPAPEDPGISLRDGRWYCTEACFYYAEPDSDTEWEFA